MDIMNYEQPTEAEVAEVLAFWDGVRAAIYAGADAAPPTPDADILARVGIHQRWQAAMACQHPEVTFTPHEGASCSTCDRPVRIVSDVQQQARVIEFVIDGPPAAESGRFVEVEDGAGRSINAGEWIERPNGMWALRVNVGGGDA